MLKAIRWPARLALKPAEKPTHISAVTRDTAGRSRSCQLRSRETETELELEMEMEMESEAACLPLDWLASLSLPNVGMMMRLHLLLTLDVHFRANSSRSAARISFSLCVKVFFAAFVFRLFSSILIEY